MSGIRLHWALTGFLVLVVLAVVCDHREIRAGQTDVQKIGEPLYFPWVPIRDPDPDSSLGVSLFYVRGSILGEPYDAGLSVVRGKIRIINNLQLGLTVPLVIDNWFSHIQRMSDTRLGSPEIEVLYRVLHLKTSRNVFVTISPYLASSLNWQSDKKPLTATIDFGFVLGVRYEIVSAIFNANLFLAFGEKTNTYLGAASGNLRIAFYGPFSFHVGIQAATDIVPKQGWDPALAVLSGIRIQTDQNVYLELGTRIGLTAEGKLLYNSMGRTAVVFNGGFYFWDPSGKSSE